MMLNSKRSLELGRAVLRENGGSWTRLYEKGQRRDDGVIVIRRSAEDALAQEPAASKDK